MASKRAIRRKSCVGKVRHADLPSALIACAKTRRGVRPYRCAFGNHWHVGHEPARVRQGRTNAIEARAFA